MINVRHILACLFPPVTTMTNVMLISTHVRGSMSELVEALGRASPLISPVYLEQQITVSLARM